MFFFLNCNCSHAVLPSIFAVPVREWLGEHACMSSSFPAPVLGGALRLVRGFRIFQRQCSWSFMYEFHHFTFLSTDESIFDISCNAYSINVCVTYAQHVFGFCSHDLSFFDYLSAFCFLLIEFHCTFSISYKMLQYFAYYYYYILIRMW